MPFVPALLLALALSGCVGAIWTDEETGETETRVYTPLDLLPDDDQAATEEDTVE